MTDSEKPINGVLALLLPASCYLVFILFTGLEYTSLSSLLSMQKISMPIILVVLVIVHAYQSYSGNAQRYDLVFALIVLLVLLLAIFTMMTDGDFWVFVQKSCYILGPWFFIAAFGYKKPELLFRSLRLVFCFVYVLNFASVLLTFNSGGFAPELGTYWLFGQRTYMRNILFPTLFFSWVYDYVQGKRCSIITALIMVINPIALYLVDSMTSLVFSIILDAIILASSFKFFRFKALRDFIVVYVVADIAIVFARKIGAFENIIMNELHRDTTLSGRTIIWDLVLEKIQQSPFMGTGLHNINDNGLELTATKNLSNAHNALLDITYKGGIIGLLLFLLLCVRCCIPVLKNKTWCAFAIGVFVGIFFLESIVGDIWYPQFFTILYLGAYINEWAPWVEETRHSNLAKNESCNDKRCMRN